jgi:hypothetical protein
MANFVFNRSKGRGVEYAERINANDPTNSVFVIRAIAASGIETDAVLLDKDDFTALVSGTTDFATNTGIATANQKDLDQTGGITVTYDDTNDWVLIDIPDQTWTAVATSPGALSDLVVGYDSDSTAGTDTNILPVSFHDFAVTPDGSDITAVIAVGGFYKAA